MRTVAIVIFPDFQLLDAAGPIAAFDTAARDAVESSAEPIEGVATRIGFGDPERMRRAFIRAFGQPPQSLRRTAKTHSADP